MQALRVRQKGAEFYLVSYPAADLLRRVRFTMRMVGVEAPSPGRRRREPDSAERFIQSVVGSDQGFQRKLIARKMRAIRDFIGLCDDQASIPTSVLLYTQEKLRFDAAGPKVSVGNLYEPNEPFTIVDGQHRLAGLDLYLKERPDEDEAVQVPVAIFDGKSSDFAAEMFVIVNSTHSKIAKSLLIDLMERVRTARREELVAARVVGMLYSEARSPLQYRINRLGGRSGQEKWILQSQLYNEIHRPLASPKPEARHRFCLERLGLSRLGERPRRESKRIDEVSERIFSVYSDWLKAAAFAFGECWGEPKCMVTKPVTLQALCRVLSDEMVEGGLVDRYLENNFNPRVFHTALSAWNRPDLHQDFRTKGFYERFAARGTPERIRVIYRRLKGTLHNG